MRSALQYQPDGEQRSLARELEAPLRALFPIARLHGGGIGEGEAVWRQLADLGILAAALPEARGGTGLGAAELALIAIELGRHLASSGVFATIVAAAATGEATPVAAGFEGGPWIAEPGATRLLFRTRTGAAIHALADGARPLADEPWGVRLMTGGIGARLAALDVAAARLMRLLDAAALAGMAVATLDMAVGYAATREQFGRPIGSFQAIKHHCADMAIAARAATDLATFAAVAIDGGRTDADRLAESAFLVAADAAIGNAGTNIQVHGGIGFSAEADPHLFLKRARLVAGLGGDSERVAERVAAASDRERTT